MNRRSPHGALARLDDDSGNMTVLTGGVIAIVLLAIGVGTALTGVHLERKELQSAADGAALYAVARVAEDAVYGGAAEQAGEPAPLTGERRLPLSQAGVREAAEQYLADYPSPAGRTGPPAVADVELLGDGTAQLTLTAVTNPPLIGWITDATGTGVVLRATATATAL